MRIIAGTAKGTRLKAPKGTAVRPTADRANIHIIRDNLARANPSGAAEIFNTDAFTALKKMAENSRKADLFFLDPPYGSKLAFLAIDSIISGQLSTTRGLIIVEHVFKDKTWLERFPHRRQKRYGDTALTFIEP